MNSHLSNQQPIKEQRITRSYRVKPELNERFTKATDKYANVKSRIIEQAIERYVIAHE
jgi:predicted DNA-binding protein